jgi:hypothetical protein
MCSALYELAISTLTQANSNHPQSSVDVSNDGVVFTCSHTSKALSIHRPRIKISSHSKCHNALNSLSMALICRCEERPIKLACSSSGGGGAYLACDTLAMRCGPLTLESTVANIRTLLPSPLTTQSIQAHAGKYGNARFVVFGAMQNASCAAARAFWSLSCCAERAGETDLLLCGGAAKVLLLLLRFIAATIYG